MALDQDGILSYLSDMHSVDTSQIDAETLLFSSGLVDSFAMIDLVSFIETESGARMNAADITLDNLDSVERIVAFVAGRG